LTLYDLEGQYSNRSYSASFLAKRFYCEKHLRNLRLIYALVIYDCIVIYIAWRDEHVRRLLY